MPSNYIPPTPHDLSRLRELDAQYIKLSNARGDAARALAAAWDAEERGEEINDEPLRKAVGRANDKLDACRDARNAEWKRVGQPLDY